MNEDARFPLSPMQDNILVGSEPPPPSLELPAALKGENLEADTSSVPSRAGSTVPTEESRSPRTLVEEVSSSTGGGRPPSAELFFQGEEALETTVGDAEAGEEEWEELPSRSDSPPPGLDVIEADALLGDEASVKLEFNAPFEVAVVDKDAESAIHALLALQREPSPTTPRSRGSSPEPFARRPLSPNPPLRQSWKGSSAIQKYVGTEASRFFCKFPRCGKAYASTDAVRKHCRQRHLDWLRRLGHGCPALYCRWED
uniref:C2H2-type domain-containing protein n=1 Tax=Haptolina ericina TaxID=156174 RepID=A0A7S3AV69_9EUKA